MANVKCKYCSTDRSVYHQRIFCKEYVWTKCPKNTDKNCNIILTKKPKRDKVVKGYVAINKEGIAYAFKPASQSDYWDKRIWTACTIHIKAKDWGKFK